jgi:uncharacterized membrane protein
MATQEEQEGGLPKNRIEALSDGILAVAMTILILEVHVPDLPPSASTAELAAALIHLWPKLAGFAVGFVILGTLWINHHYQFHYVRRTDRVLLWLNLLFLLSVSCLPFTVALVGSFGTQTIPAAAYGAVLLAAGTCLLLHWRYATKGRRCVAADLEEATVKALERRILLGMFGYGLGFALAFVAPRGSLATYALLPLLYFVPSKIDHHVRAPRG